MMGPDSSAVSLVSDVADHQVIISPVVSSSGDANKTKELGLPDEAAAAIPGGSKTKEQETGDDVLSSVDEEEVISVAERTGGNSTSSMMVRPLVSNWDDGREEADVSMFGWPVANLSDDSESDSLDDQDDDEDDRDCYEIVPPHERFGAFPAAMFAGRLREARGLLRISRSDVTVRYLAQSRGTVSRELELELRAHRDFRSVIYVLDGEHGRRGGISWMNIRRDLFPRMFNLMALLLSNRIEDLTVEMEITEELKKRLSVEIDEDFTYVRHDGKRFFNLVGWICWHLRETIGGFNSFSGYADPYGWYRLHSVVSFKELFEKLLPELGDKSIQFWRIFSGCIQKNAVLPEIWRNRGLIEILNEMRAQINTLREAFYRVSVFQVRASINYRTLASSVFRLQGGLEALAGWIALLEAVMESLQCKEQKFNGFLTNFASWFGRRLGI